MLQRETMPSASSTAVELSENWRNSLKEQWEGSLQGVLQLPTTSRGLLIYVLALVLIAGALAIHVMLSVQIMAAQVQVTNMERELAWIEQTNSEITYQIVQNTSMAKMNRRALEQGYSYKVKRLYVNANASTGQSAAAPVIAKQPSPQTDAALSDTLEANRVHGDERELSARLGGMRRDMLQRAQAATMEGIDAIGEFAATQEERASEFMGGRTEWLRQRMGQRMGQWLRQWLGGAQPTE